MTVAEVARHVSVSEKTVRRAIKDGQLKARKFRRCWRIETEDIDAWGDPSVPSPSVKPGARAVVPSRAASSAALLAIERGGR